MFVRITNIIISFYSCLSRVNLSPDVEESGDSHMTREFAMSELIGIIPFLDFTDEVGR